MVQVVTAFGPRSVGSWGIQLQGHSANGGRLDVQALQASPHDLLVIDFSADGSQTGRFIAEDVHRLKSRSDQSVVLAYLPIGGVFDYRSNWDRAWTSDGLAAGTPTAQAPSWLGPLHPSCPNARLVRYWDEGWQQTLFDARRNGWADLIAAQGFDGFYLDLVDTHAAWSGQGDGAPASPAEAARRMAEAICRLAGHIRTRYPDALIVPANAEAVLAASADALAPPGAPDLLETISAVAVEDVLCPGTMRENNPLAPDEARIRMLNQTVLAAGKPVLSIDYADDPALVDALSVAAAKLGFLPYAAPTRDLDRLGPAYEGDIARTGLRPGELPPPPTRSRAVIGPSRPADAPIFRWKARHPAAPPA